MNPIGEMILNDSYRLLELLYNNQVNILNETFCPLTQEEMAKELGVTRVTINTNLKKLKEIGLIENYKNKKYKLTQKGSKCVKIIKKL